VDIVFGLVAVTCEDSVVDEGLDGGRAASFFGEEVEGKRAIGGDEGTDGAAAPGGSAAFDSISGDKRLLRGDREANDFGDTGATTGALELVATFGKPSTNQDAEGSVEAAGRELGLYGALECALLLWFVGKCVVEDELAFGERLGI
jgi:hypothetical protein